MVFSVTPSLSKRSISSAILSLRANETDLGRPQICLMSVSFRRSEQTADGMVPTFSIKISAKSDISLFILTLHVFSVSFHRVYF